MRKHEATNLKFQSVSSRPLLQRPQTRPSNNIGHQQRTSGKMTALVHNKLLKLSWENVNNQYISEQSVYIWLFWWLFENKVMKYCDRETNSRVAFFPESYETNKSRFLPLYCRNLSFPRACSRTQSNLVSSFPYPKISVKKSKSLWLFHKKGFHVHTVR